MPETPKVAAAKDAAAKEAAKEAKHVLVLAQKQQELLQRQMRTGDLISSFLRNTTKIGTAGITPAYLKTRLGLLAHYWKEYMGRDAELEPARVRLENEDYFAKAIYVIIEINYVDTKSELLTIL